MASVPSWRALLRKSPAPLMAKKRTPRPRIAAPSRRRLTPARSRTSHAETALDVHRCEQFVLHEARLLDEAKFDDWLALFTDDGWYWVPGEPGQANPPDTVPLV